jgi:hypothetical protein
MCGMIIETTKQKVQTSGNIQSASCTIDAEDMRYIASLLRNNYSDTILATMREIIANGIDVSNGRKVDVQLPTKLEPNFIVKDYGCGLSEEDMMGLYTKYGKSTKRDSNNAIGGFGIGRFAPLSYTDSFIVISVCDGQKTAYTIRVDENDDTVVSKMFSESAKEDNGIYVQVPIQIKDIESFKLKFKKFSRYLGDKINLLNEEWDQELPNFSCDSFDFYEKQSHLFNVGICFQKPHVLMGSILYPVVEDSRYPCFKRGVVYKAEIGEFKLHHSRESLEYNDKTVAALSKASEKIQSDVEKNANEQIKDAECLYDAIKMFAKFKFMLYNLVGNFKNLKINWGDFPISEKVFGFSNCQTLQKISKNRQGNLSTKAINSSWNFSDEPLDRRYFIIDDGVMPRSPHNRLSWLKDNEEVYLITLKDEEMGRFKAMNSKHVSLLSSHERSFKSINRQTAKKGDVKKGDILLFEPPIGYACCTNSQFWKEVEEELSDDKTHYYYVYNANKIESPCGRVLDARSVYENLTNLRKLDSKIDKVYGVRKKALKKIEKKSNWIRMDEIEEKIINDSPILKNAKRYEELRGLIRGYDLNFMTRALEKSPSKKIILNFKKLLNDINKMERPERVHKVNLDRIKIDLSKEVKIKEDFLSAYPMVKHLANSHQRPETIEEDLVSYLTKW